MDEWIKGNGTGAGDRRIEVEIEHCNPALELPNKIIKGRFGEDCFYFDEGGELSYNWDILRWRHIEEGGDK